MKSSIASIATGIILVAITTATLFAVPTFAVGPVEQGIQATKVPGVPSTIMGDGGVVTTIINVMLFIVGILSVIMLIYGGLRYVISGGNSSSVTAAKNTILYAIVGLVIALFAYAIVNFVLGAATGSFTGGGGTNV